MTSTLRMNTAVGVMVISFCRLLLIYIFLIPTLFTYFNVSFLFRVCVLLPFAFAVRIIQNFIWIRNNSGRIYQFSFGVRCALGIKYKMLNRKNKTSTLFMALSNKKRAVNTQLETKQIQFLLFVTSYGS